MSSTSSQDSLIEGVGDEVLLVGGLLVLSVVVLVVWQQKRSSQQARQREEENTNPSASTGDRHAPQVEHNVREHGSSEGLRYRRNAVGRQSDTNTDETNAPQDGGAELGSSTGRRLDTSPSSDEQGQDSPRGAEGCEDLTNGQSDIPSCKSSHEVPRGYKDMEPDTLPDTSERDNKAKDGEASPKEQLDTSQLPDSKGRVSPQESGTSPANQSTTSPDEPDGQQTDASQSGSPTKGRSKTSLEESGHGSPDASPGKLPQETPDKSGRGKPHGVPIGKHPTTPSPPSPRCGESQGANRSGTGGQAPGNTRDGARADAGSNSTVSGGGEIKVRLIQAGGPGHAREMNVSPQITMGDLRRNYFENELAEHRPVKFIYQGRVISDDSTTLSDLGIGDGGAMHVHVGRPRPPDAPQAPADGAEVLQPSRLLVPLFGVMLGVVWVCMFVYPHVFTFTSTVFLFVLSLGYAVFTYASM